MEVGAGAGIAKRCSVGADSHPCDVLEAPPPPHVLYHAQGMKPSRMMGKEGYHQRMHLISIKMTLFPN